VKVVLPASGPPVGAPPLLQVALFADLALALACAAAGPASTWAPGLVPLPVAFAWWVSAYGVLLGLADLAAARMSPAGIAWRRRLGYVAMGAVVWRNGPLSDPRFAVAVVAWMGFTWVALVVGGRSLSRAIASATGEDKPE
jgi:hypothetical protein